MWKIDFKNIFAFKCQMVIFLEQMLMDFGYRFLEIIAIYYTICYNFIFTDKTKK